MKFSKMNQSIEYYDQNFNEFNQKTYNVNMQNLYEPFLANIPSKGYLLDLGCGSGRDALYFKKHGYQIDAIDYSIKLVELAKRQTGINVRHASFYDLNEVEKYDGIWACASLLHCDRNRLTEVIGRIVKALKITGVCYMSFKYGDQDREKDGRFFTDLNETQLETLLMPFDLKIIKQWITKDNRPEYSEQWINIILQKLN